MTQTADHYLQLEMGRLMVTIALLRAELDQAKEALTRAEAALARATAAAAAADTER
jgi:hypothetical protein